MRRVLPPVGKVDTASVVTVLLIAILKVAILFGLRGLGMPSADLWVGQTDEGALGFTYEEVDQALYLLVDDRFTVDEVAAEGFDRKFVEDVWRRVKINHYKRTMPNIAKISKRTIGHDFLYLRDYTGR